MTTAKDRLILQLRSRQKMLSQEVLMYQRVLEGLRRNFKFNRLLRLIIDSVRLGMGFKRAGIFLVEPDRKSVRLALGINASGGYERHQKKRPSYLISGHDWFTRIVSGKTQYILTNNYPKKMRHKVWEKKVVVLNNACVPIRLGGQVIGILAVDNLAVNRPITREDVSILRNFATQVGLALQSVKAHEQILDLTVTDPLTGLRNRRYFEQALDLEARRCYRYGRSFSLLMVDLDHFKRVNDRWGHDAGDEVLRQVAALMRDNLRSLDVVARIGGEEFAILLPETPPHNIALVAERLLRQVREARWSVGRRGARRHRLTLSLGMASYLRGKVRPGELMKLADKSLYQAKRRGRDQAGSLQVVSR